ncbi:MAG TPA: hypothetical protein VHL57_00865, partial [Flavobacteriales bacterium]|nr:hypothetical protein [Flavobacteriales bacterium]
MPPLPPRIHSLSHRSALVIGALTGTLGLSAQCTGSLDLGPDPSACTGTQVVLHAPPGFVSYAWEDGSSGPDHTVTAPGSFTCTATQFGGTSNLVVNGDFSTGYAGFTSDYTVGTGGAWGPVSLEATYAVTTDPFLAHSNFASCGDHTTGTGQMMVVNGAQTPDLSIWCQTVAVQPNTDYAFSAWIASAVSEDPAILAFNINGSDVGAPLTATYLTCDWQQFYAVWNSGPNTSVTLCLTNQNVAPSGNDFLLDDISFSPLCVYTDVIQVLAIPYPQPDLGTDVSVCTGTPVTLDPHWPTADSYQWNNGVFLPTLTPIQSATYWVDVTEDGCTTR